MRKRYGRILSLKTQEGSLIKIKKEERKKMKKQILKPIILAIIFGTSLSAYADGDVDADYKMSVLNPEVGLGYIKLKNDRADINVGVFSNSKGIAGGHLSIGLEHKMGVFGKAGDREGFVQIYLNPGVDLKTNYDFKKNRAENIDLEVSGIGAFRAQQVGYSSRCKVVNKYSDRCDQYEDSKPYGSIDIVGLPTTFKYKMDRELGLGEQVVRIGFFDASGHVAFTINELPMDIFGALGPGYEVGKIFVHLDDYKQENITSGKNSISAPGVVYALIGARGKIGVGLGHTDNTFGRLGYEYIGEQMVQEVPGRASGTGAMITEQAHNVSWQKALSDDTILKVLFASKDSRVSSNYKKHPFIQGEEAENITHNTHNTEHVLSAGISF